MLNPVRFASDIQEEFLPMIIIGSPRKRNPWQSNVNSWQSMAIHDNLVAIHLNFVDFVSLLRLSHSSPTLAWKHSFEICAHSAGADCECARRAHLRFTRGAGFSLFAQDTCASRGVWSQIGRMMITLICWLWIAPVSTQQRSCTQGADHCTVSKWKFCTPVIVHIFR